jgi:rRNA-processing protein FCF1
MLGDVHTAVGNLWSGGGPGTAQERVAGYLEWVTNTMQQLGSQIAAADLDRLVLTPGYDRLLSAAGTMTGTDIATQRVLNGMVSLELKQRVDAFDAAVKALEKQIQRWSRRGVFVAADTSFYIEHENKLEEVDFRPLLQVWEDPVHLLVPIVVVDELDSLKKSKDTHERWRASYTLAVLDRVFANSTEAAQLTPEDFSVLGSGGIPRGEVTIELVFDPPGHVRLPINDDEIIDRVMAVQPLAAREVTLLTYDTGQSTRARNAGLRVKKLAQPAKSEPATAARTVGNGKP